MRWDSIPLRGGGKDGEGILWNLDFIEIIFLLRGAFLLHGIYYIKSN